MSMDVPYRDTIVSAGSQLRRVEQWLIRRPPSKALDTAHEMRWTLDMITQGLAGLAAGRNTFPEEMKGDFRKVIADTLGRPAKPYLIKRACRETDVDYDALIEAFDTVYYLR